MGAALSLHARGTSHFQNQNFVLAEEMFRLWVQETEARVHPMHAALVFPLGCLGWAIAAQGKFDQAERTLLRGLVIAGKARSAATKGHDVVLQGLIFVYERQSRTGDRTQMVDALERLRGTAFQVSFGVE
jgi:hypothetical protein